MTYHFPLLLNRSFPSAPTDGLAYCFHTMMMMITPAHSTTNSPVASHSCQRHSDSSIILPFPFSPPPFLHAPNLSALLIHFSLPNFARAHSLALSRCRSYRPHPRLFRTPLYQNRGSWGISTARSIFHSYKLLVKPRFLYISSVSLHNVYYQIYSPLLHK